METVVTKKEITVTITFTEREAKLLACLVGALSPADAEENIRRGVNFDEWFNGKSKLGRLEVADFTSVLYNSIYILF